MGKKVTEEEIKRVIKEYIERMFELFKTHHGVTTDSQIDCPQCGRYRGISLENGRWRCSWMDCIFTLPEEFIPPTPAELEAFYNWERIKEKIGKFLNN